MMLVLSGLALATGVLSHNGLVSSKSQLLDRHAFYLAEAGLHRARQALVTGTWTAALSPGATYIESFGPGEYRVTIVDNANSTYTITSDGYVPTQTTVVAQRRVVEAALAVTANTNLSLTATASASSASGPHTAAKAKDGDLTTYWKANTSANGEWLAMNFGSPKTVAQAIVREDGKTMETIQIQSSSDGSSWTTLATMQNESAVLSGGDATWTILFAATSAQYVRMLVTDTGGAKPKVKECETYAAGIVSALGKGTVTTQW